MQYTLENNIDNAAYRKLFLDRLVKNLPMILSAAVVVVLALTYGALEGLFPFSSERLRIDSDMVVILITINVALLILLAGIVARHVVVQLWLSTHPDMAGSWLQNRLATTFSLVAVIPAFLITVSSVIFFNIGFEEWFDKKVSAVVSASQEIADTYVSEHHEALLEQLNAMVYDLQRDYFVNGRLIPDENNAAPNLETTLTAHAQIRKLDHVVVFDEDRRVHGATELAYGIVHKISDSQIAEAAVGSARFITSETDDGKSYLRALIRFPEAGQYLLLIGKTVDTNVISRAESVNDVFTEYEALKQRRTNWQIGFALFYVVATSLLLVLTVWVALKLAERIVKPITDLAAKSDLLARGDLRARVSATQGENEISNLGRAFNRMAEDIAKRRDELEHRRQFMESVLSGVSAGVIGLDSDGIVEIPNRRAQELLAISASEIVGQPLRRVVSEFAVLLDPVLSGQQMSNKGNIHLVRNEHGIELMVRIDRVHEIESDDASREHHKISGLVVTFDDQTALVAAQAKSAWSDVVQTVAHEINNPMTPIYYAAIRLKNRFLPQIKDSPEVFESCMREIIRQTTVVKSMVKEFENYAEVPPVEMLRNDIVMLIEDTLNIADHATDKVRFERSYAAERIFVLCDEWQLARVLNNVLLNAVRAIERSGNPDDGVVRVSVVEADRHCIISVSDNGCGLPDVPKEDLLKPKVTHDKEKGSGFGLAVIKDIMDKHGGDLELKDNDGPGACVTLRLRLAETGAK